MIIIIIILFLGGDVGVSALDVHMYFGVYGD